MNRLLGSAIAIVCAATLWGCGEDDPGTESGTGGMGGAGTGGTPTAGAGGTAGMGGAAGMSGTAGMGGMPPGNCMDLTTLPTTPVSLKNDVMPIFGGACALGTACHGDGSANPKAGLFLGPPGVFDMTLGMLVYTTPEQSVIDQVHASVVADSTTTPGVARVVPTDPANSFLVQKLQGIHNDQGYTCTKQDNRAADPCGDPMPPPQGFCMDARFPTVAAWIQQGALNN